MWREGAHSGSHEHTHTRWQFWLELQCTMMPWPSSKLMHISEHTFLSKELSSPLPTYLLQHNHLQITSIIRLSVHPLDRPPRSTAHFVTSDRPRTFVLRVPCTVKSAARGTSLYRMLLGRGKRTLATSLSHNNRLIIVFVSNKSEHNRLHVPVLFWAS